MFTHQKEKFTILKIRHLTIRSSLRHKQCDVIGDFVFQNLPEYDISNLYLQYSFVFSFTNIFLTIRQEQTSLFNHWLSRQWGPHVRPRAMPGAMPRAVLSFTNNTVDKEYNQSYFENNQSYFENNQSYFENNTILPILQSYNDWSAVKTTTRSFRSSLYYSMDSI